MVLMSSTASMAILACCESLSSPTSSTLKLLIGTFSQKWITPASSTMVLSMCSSSSWLWVNALAIARNVASVIWVLSKYRRRILHLGKTLANDRQLLSVISKFRPSTSVFRDEPGRVSMRALACSSPMLLSPISSSFRLGACDTTCSSGLMSAKLLPSSRSSCTFPLHAACRSSGRASSGRLSSPKSHLVTVMGSFAQNAAQSLTSTSGLFDTPMPCI
mmetsp:Transcript_16593/g.38351  ORF Transcript_16593/g.38351 Transcript_16593/m.38351 type:complete len:218 (-) Transcript_16593:304-957(-)